MKAIILAAGFGERMQPVTLSLPKPLLPLAGKPVIINTIRKLYVCGVKDIIINLYHLPEKIKKEVESKITEDVNISFSEESVILGTAGGIKLASTKLKGEEYIVINSDIVTDIDFSEVIKFHHDKEAVCTMVLRKDPNIEKYGLISVSKNSRIVSFLGKPKKDNMKVTDYMYTGVQIVNNSFLSEIPDGVYCDLSKEIYPKLVNNNSEMYGFISDKYWTDIGNPERYLEANIKEVTKTSTSKWKNNKNIIPIVSVGEGTEISSSSIIGPNCSIGSCCSIGSDVKISNSVIMDNVKIGSGTEIRDSIIGPGVFLIKNSPIVGKIIACVKGKNIIKKLEQEINL